MKDLGMIEDEIRAVVDYSRAERIEKGFSFEKKYLLSGTGERSYIARICEVNSEGVLARKREEFDLIRRLHGYSSLVPEAYLFGVSCDGKSCYMVLEYVQGSDLEKAMPHFSGEEQYKLGLQAGRELLSLHRMDAPRLPAEWHERYSRKYARKWARFSESGIETGVIDIEQLSRFISENEQYMRCQRETFLHDDFHPANLIADGGNLAGIIDFNRYDWGDPVHDFVKVAYFSSKISVPFSAGQIDGYNGGDVPKEFWKKYSLYTAMMMIQDMVWSHWYEEQTGSPGEIERMQERTERVWSDHDGFRDEFPGWYRDFSE
ncbi:phosphotransferase family protein [Methanolacinia paynteri]|uniref:phosphotransferase family protein n=1 Tax=Methanolacinia paynteri TaxID=230356 RepID=UPI00064E66BF|nr:aminoglycoside phosphotransferase family protein [Methanolacinia paynteri]